MADVNLSYIEHLQKCYNLLRRSRLVKQAPVVSDDSLQHFLRILNSALPRKGVLEEECIDKCIKTQYFWNQRGFIRSLHPNRTNKNARKDARCFVLLTIGLEIVQEFELDKVVHLTWNKDTHQYTIESLIDPNNIPDPVTFRSERAEARNERNTRRKRVPVVLTPEAAQIEQNSSEVETVVMGAWGDSTKPQ